MAWNSVGVAKVMICSTAQAKATWPWTRSGHGWPRRRTHTGLSGSETQSGVIAPRTVQQCA
jgi:hypothetical protein